MIIRIILVAFVLIALQGVLSRFRRREIGVRLLSFWLLLWVAVGLAVVFPGATTVVATKLGVGRGLDLLLVLAVVALFYSQFKILARLDRLEQNLTIIVREIAIRSERD
jgi:small membrane protein